MDASVSYARVPLAAGRWTSARPAAAYGLVSAHAVLAPRGRGAVAASAWGEGTGRAQARNTAPALPGAGIDPLELLTAESLSLRALGVVRGLGLRELAHAANSSSSTLRGGESGDFVSCRTPTPFARWLENSTPIPHGSRKRW